MNREKNLEEMLISTIVGGLIAIILVALVPERMTGFETVAYFLLYWMMGIFGVWTMFDFADQLRKEGNEQ